MFFRKCLVTFGLTLLCLPVSLSAQAGWKVVKDRTNSCQISVPENWGQSVFMVRSDGKVRVFSAETQTMVAERMLENGPQLVFYVRNRTRRRGRNRWSLIRPLCPGTDITAPRKST